MNPTSAYLAGKTLLITGATGFLGQPLVEKILSAAPGVARIYVLIRPKRQSPGVVLSPEKRLEKELYESSVFDRLRATHGAGLDAFLREKLIAVGGDISEAGLGIDPTVAERLRVEVDVVINSAAVVSFDAPLDDALQLNVLGARRVAEFAAACRDAVLVHVSTAYVAGASHAIADETLYHTAPAGTDVPFPRGYITDPERDIEQVRALIAGCETESRQPEVERELLRVLLQRARAGRNGKTAGRRKAIESLRRKWLENRLVASGMQWARDRGWNDTYTYTKALGEQVVTRACSGIPVIIVRPSVIESSLSEPIPGWLDGLRMADPLIAAIGKGRLRSLPLNPDVHLDLVPVDMVVNALLAALPRGAPAGGLACYQVATGSRNPISLGDLYDLIYRYFVRNPMLDKSGRPIRIKYLRFPSKGAFRLQHRLRRVPLESAERALDRVSGLDAASRAKRRVSATRAALDKLYYYGEIYEPYLNMNCRFEVDRTMALYESMSAEEKALFPFDVSRLNWRHYIQNVHIPGIKRYILKMEGNHTAHLEPPGAEPRPQTIGDVLVRSAARFGDKTALQIRRGGEWQRWSYVQLLHEAEAMRDRLLALGLNKGDRVVLWSENQPEWGVAALGAALAGIVIVPLDWQTWPPEVWSIARFTGARALLVSELCAKRIEASAAAEPLQIVRIDEGAAAGDDARAARPAVPATGISAGAAPAETPAADDPASIIFTSGTASDPKGAVHTHRSFLANVFGTLRLTPALDDTDQMLSVLPLYHALEFTCGFLAPLWLGATVTYGTALKPKAIFEAMRETGTTMMLGVPTLYALLRDDLERRVLRMSRDSDSATGRSRSRRARFTRAQVARVRAEMGGRIRFVVSGGSSLGRELYDDFAALGVPVYEGYGLTETAPVLTFNPAGHTRGGSVGKPLPGVELRLSHPDGDGVGEIVVRTPSLMRGYWDNPAATAKAIQAGWLHTGDLGWVDEDGYVYITGRIKDVIVTGAGKNVYPADLEAIYSRVPGVLEVGVVGVKSGLTEEVHAAVWGGPDAAADPSADARLRRDLQQLGRELPSYHRLQHVHVWSEPLPRDASGALRRDQLSRDVLARIEQRGPAAAPAAASASAAPVYPAARIATDIAAPGRGGLASAAGSQDGLVLANETELIAELARLSGVPVAAIHPGTDLYGDLGLDSLEAVELLLFLEAHYGIAVADERADSVRTVADLLREVACETSGRGPSARIERFPSELPAGDRTAMDRAFLHWSLSGIETFYRTYLHFEPPQVDGVLPASGAYIIAANHSSHLDVGAILAAVATTRGRDAAARLHVLGARDYFFDSPVKSWFFSRFFNVVPIRREQTGLDGLRVARSILAAGEPVLIFPEATRSRTGGMQAFKPGLGLLAFETGAAIVPARIDGTYQSLPAGRFLPRSLPVRVRFGQPLSMERYRTNGAGRDEIYRRIASDVRECIELLSVSAGG